MSVTIQSYGDCKITIKTGLFINNEFKPSVGGTVMTTPNPATGEDLATISSATAEDVDIAVSAARLAFETTWGKKSTPNQRSSLLNKWAELIEADIDSLAELESLDNGKPNYSLELPYTNVHVESGSSFGCWKYNCDKAC